MIFTSVDPATAPWRAGQSVTVQAVEIDGKPGSIVTRNWRAAHKPNPILLDFRKRPDVDLWGIGFAMFANFGGLKTWDEPAHTFHSLTLATPEQVDHAVRVLDKLAALR